MPLYVCRRYDGIARPREGQRLKWVRARDLRDYPMPPADEPLIPHLMETPLGCGPRAVCPPKILKARLRRGRPVKTLFIGQEHPGACGLWKLRGIMGDYDLIDEDLDESRLRDQIVEMRTGLLRATLLFGSIAIALALIIAPAARKGADYVTASNPPQLDMISTGSIGSSNSHYIVRRSVLQAPGAGPCLMFPSGERRGAC